MCEDVLAWFVQLSSFLLMLLIDLSTRSLLFMIALCSLRLIYFSLPVLSCWWLPFFDVVVLMSGRASILLYKIVSDKVLACLSVWSKLQMNCAWSSWCRWCSVISCFIKIEIVSLLLWCQLTQIVLNRRLEYLCPVLLTVWNVTSLVLSWDNLYVLEMDFIVSYLFLIFYYHINLLLCVYVRYFVQIQFFVVIDIILLCFRSRTSAHLSCGPCLRREIDI